MDPTWLVGGAGILSGLVNALKGPSAQEKLYKYLSGEAMKPLSQLGYTPEEKGALRFGTKNRLTRMLGERGKASAASASRRGVSLGSQFFSDLEGRYGRAYGAAIPEIDLESMRYARERKSNLLNMLTGLTSTMPDNSLDLSGLANNLALFELLKQNKQNGGGLPFLGDESGSARWPT